jgi:hypothetical protein
MGRLAATGRLVTGKGLPTLRYLPTAGCRSTSFWVQSCDPRPKRERGMTMSNGFSELVKRLLGSDNRFHSGRYVDVWC